MIDALVRATNEHDLESLVACFHADYVNETPVHPPRGFRGDAQVRRNWNQILGSVPDLRAEVPRRAVDGDTVWTEWDMSGTRQDGAAFAIRGVVIFGVTEGKIASARFYLEPVEENSGNVNAAVSQVTGNASADAAGARS
ncbi:MAG TPA: nuclear transport factor 2 family protein [Solirubrobacteraceae bacterium]|nr:nuclear transport factor 2 family protein [Solirubrobacteraceae bacterium]